MLYICYFLLINVVTLYVMGIDKKRARTGSWRVKEATLWWCALAGGALGGFIAMRLFRHKTKRRMFQYGFLVLMVVQLYTIYYLTSL